jgi:NitT/TauT family transport system substrate-binding protein
LMLLSVVISCTPPDISSPPHEVTVQLKWLHQAQFAGCYVAQDRGYYAAENLKVSFLEGGQGIDIAHPVIAGKADFGVVSPEDLLIQRSQGSPITAIASIYRRSAVVFVSLAESGILRPADFLGRTVATTGASGAVRDFEFQFQALARKLSIDTSRIKLVRYDPDYVDFCNGNVDVTSAYLTGGVNKMREKGYKLNLIWPGDYGIHFYSDILITSERMITEQPDIIIRFLRATLKGWREAIGNPDAAALTTLKYAKDSNLKAQTVMMESLLPLVHTGEDEVGWMRGVDWQQMYDILVDQGIIQGLPRGIREAYTMQFLNTVYEGGTK